jgi:hypothetical protein
MNEMLVIKVEYQRCATFEAAIPCYLENETKKVTFRRSINDDLMFISSITVAMVKNHANDESQMTCERQWPDLNPSKSLFWFRFLNNMEWQPQRSHTFDIIRSSFIDLLCPFFLSE